MSEKNAEEIAALQAAMDEQKAAVAQEREELNAAVEQFNNDKATLAAKVQTLSDKVAELEATIANEPGPVDLSAQIAEIKANTAEIQAFVTPEGPVETVAPPEFVGG